ncbi:MAG TPA: hypothetical protein VG826_05265 [Pirellulales bacterium]|nr:hypothetical protein [Pirellulales bacterium]
MKTARNYDEPVGVCTISSDSNGPRQNWLACPYRTLDQHFTLLATAVRTTYGIGANVNLILTPVTALDRPERQAIVKGAVGTGTNRVFAFSAGKLGGEVDIPETDSSPGGKVDMTVMEITGLDSSGCPTKFGKHMFYEIQTADFHGSPLHATTLLKNHFPQAAAGFSSAFEAEFCGTKVEGPNKANIFKRTIYQMILKMQLARHPDCAGFFIILPKPVWDSWLRHLGRPTLTQIGDDPLRQALSIPPGQIEQDGQATAWVLVFDIDVESSESPKPLKILHLIHTSASALRYYAFDAASDFALAHDVIQRFREVMAARVIEGWRHQVPPDADAPDAPRSLTPKAAKPRRRRPRA